MANERPIDVRGSDIVSTALLELLNTYPGLKRYHNSGEYTSEGFILLDPAEMIGYSNTALEPDRRIRFSTLDDKSGVGFFPLSGAVLTMNKKSITGHVRQRCSYPFNVVYRAAPKSEEQKLVIKEWLDVLGRWLEQQQVTIYGQTEKLESYPLLDEGRIITGIQRSSPAHLSAAYQDGAEDWSITMTLTYKYEFDT